MDLHDPICEAIEVELSRQAETSGGQLTVRKTGDRQLAIDGEIDLDAVAMAIAGSIAGGP